MFSQLGLKAVPGHHPRAALDAGWLRIGAWGGLLIGITENLAGGYFSGSGMKEVAGFAMIIVVLMIRPFGNFRRNATNREGFDG